MIIGPNGTGKSTISSAILIGLGFPPAFLGRSNKGTTGFIRLGQPFAETEIELRGKDGVKNMVIFRRFGIDKADNEFKIDGVAATKQRVVETVAELGIVANLWSVVQMVCEILLIKSATTCPRTRSRRSLLCSRHSCFSKP